MFKVVFRDSSLYPKQLSLFFLLLLISASADRIGDITNFCSMITVARAQNRSCQRGSIQGFDNGPAGRKDY